MPPILNNAPLTDDNTDILANHAFLRQGPIEYDCRLLDKEGKIRLVQIQPCSDEGDVTSLVVCQFDFLPDQKSNSIALSYVWGAPAPTYRVYIDNQDRSGWLFVRQGLYDFLCTARSLNEPSTWLWIDQICINQEDDVEKGHQANQMAHFYTHASSTLMRLEPGFVGSDEAIDLVFEIGE